MNDLFMGLIAVVMFVFAAFGLMILVFLLNILLNKVLSWLDKRMMR